MPQYSALMRWDGSARPSAADLAFTAPAGANPIHMVDLSKGEAK
jgi:hypothetical protein